MQELDLYERKILNDEEFPIQIYMNKADGPGQYFLAHWHEHIELHYVLKGKVKIQINQTFVEAQKNDLVVVNSNELHAGYCVEGPAEILVIIFEMSSFSKELAGHNIIFNPLIKGDPEVDQLIHTAWSEYQRQELGYRLRCRGALMYLITHLVRNHTAQILSKQDHVKRMQNLQRLNTTITYIHEHYREEIRNKELSKLVHLSEGRFSHLFKEGMDMGPQQYVNQVRLKKAMSLLKSKRMTVAEVALAVGFTDYNNFGRMFRKYYGYTPAEAKKK